MRDHCEPIVSGKVLSVHPICNRLRSTSTAGCLCACSGLPLPKVPQLPCFQSSTCLPLCFHATKIICHLIASMPRFHADACKWWWHNDSEHYMRPPSKVARMNPRVTTNYITCFSPSHLRHSCGPPTSNYDPISVSRLAVLFLGLQNHYLTSLLATHAIDAVAALKRAPSTVHEDPVLLDLDLLGDAEFCSIKAASVCHADHHRTLYMLGSRRQIPPATPHFRQHR
jgi:hypothetical protein